MDKPILYSFRRCPYAMRARLSLLRAGITCEMREVVLRDRPTHMLEISPKGTVPVLLLPNGEVLEESLDIMNWASEKIESAGWSKTLIQNSQSLVDELDNDFKYNLDRYKYPNRYEDVDHIFHRDANLEFLQQIDQLLSENQFLSGKERGYLDCAIFPFVRQFANHDRNWFDSLDLENMRNWLESCLESEEFKTTMKKFPQWKEGDELVYWP